MYTFQMSSHTLFSCEHPITFMTFISKSFMFYLDVTIEAILAIVLMLTNMAVKCDPFMVYQYMVPKISAQRVPEPDPLPGIFFDTRPDPIQF